MESIDKKDFCSIIHNQRIDTFRIDIYNIKPYMLFGRMIIDGAVVSCDNNRLVIRDTDYTVFMNLSIDEIDDICLQKYSEEVYQIVLTTRGIWYKIVVTL